MKLTITIDMDGAAFEDGRDRELVGIFLSIRESIAMGLTSDAGYPFPIFDSNGNRCGDWKVRDHD